MKRNPYPRIIKWAVEMMIAVLCLFSFVACNGNGTRENLLIKSISEKKTAGTILKTADTIPLPQDSTAYRLKMLQLANHDKAGKWPPVTAIPAQSAILPYKRIVAFYGNFYSTQMGILGEYAASVVIQKLKKQVAEWERADSGTAVIPAIHYIAVTAQKSPGDGNYRLRMPDSEILKAIALADSVKGIVFLDVQVGLSNLKNELPRLEKFLKLPNVHLGIDPEFSMKNGNRPGTSVGTFDAADVNYATAMLLKTVKQYQLPPKILVVHRFTAAMLTNYKNIITRPEVQVVINMDGFGSPTLKKSTYRYAVYGQPVQFTGFKLFYKNDVKKGGRLMTAVEILQLQPRPVYIQYQ